MENLAKVLIEPLCKIYEAVSYPKQPSLSRKNNASVLQDDSGTLIYHL